MSGLKRTGVIRWWNAAKGYGFIIPNDGGDDALVHAKVLTPMTQHLLGEGVRVTYECALTERGARVTWLELDQDRFEIWPLPSPCSHEIACKDRVLNVIAVFHTMEMCERWVDEQRNHR